MASENGWVLKSVPLILSADVKYMFRKCTTCPRVRGIEAYITQRNIYLKEISIYLISKGICKINAINAYLIKRNSGSSNRLQNENVFTMSTYLSIRVNSI
jgi:hypothetical protein